MKKFLTFVSVLGCVLILAGAGVATVAFSYGGNPFRAVEDVGVRLRKYSDEMEYEFGRLEEHAEQVAIGVAHEILDEIHSEQTMIYAETVIEDANFDDGYQEGMTVVASENGTYSFEMNFDEVTNLEIEIRGGEVTVVRDEEGGSLTLLSDNGKESNIVYKNMDRYQKLEVIAEEDEEYIIRIPEGWVLSEVEVDCKGGNFEGENILTEDAEFVVGGGNVEVSQLGGKNTSIECAGGVVEWTGMGEISRSLDIECAGGKVELTLDDGVDASKVGYDIEYIAGKVEFFDETFEGFGEYRSNAKAGMPHLEIEVAGGAVTVQ